MTGDKTGSVDFGCCLCSSMEEQFRPKERVGGSSPSRGTTSNQVSSGGLAHELCAVVCLQLVEGIAQMELYGSF
jgi:hypothetical protein